MPTLTTLTVNTHMGAALEGAVQLLRTHRPDWVSLQEIPDLVKLHRAIDGLGYAMVPEPGGAAGTVILLRRKTMRLGRATNRRVSRRRDRMHPERRRTTARAVHVETGRVCVLHAVHTWAMGDGWASPPAVIRGHVKQVRAIAGSCMRRRAQTVVLAAGDWNENLSSTDRHGGKSAVAIMDDARMLPAHRVAKQRGSTSLEGSSLLDDVFYRSAPFLRLQSRETLRIPGRGADHLAVMTVHNIKEIDS